MQAEQWWKNFAMGRELDIGARFIYNAIHEFHVTEHLDDAGSSFEVLYGLSVGIERLQKVAIVLYEYDGLQEPEKFLESLITHSTHALHDRLDKTKPQGLAHIHKEFLALLTEFYSKHRYGRFSLDVLSNIDGEHLALRDFIVKHLRLESTNGVGPSIRNDDTIRRFLSKVVRKIVRPLYEAIKNRAFELGIYTYEMSSDSKTAKVFLEDRLDFVDEDKVRRELLVYLTSDPARGEHVQFLRTLEPLELDPALAPDFAKYLLYDTPKNCAFVKEHVVVEFEHAVEDVPLRFEMLDALDRELFFDPDEFGEAEA